MNSAYCVCVCTSTNEGVYVTLDTHNLSLFTGERAKLEYGSVYVCRWVIVCEQESEQSRFIVDCLQISECICWSFTYAVFLFVYSELWGLLTT